MSKRRITQSYLDAQSEIILSLVDRGYINISIRDIVNQIDYDYRVMGPDQKAAIVSDLQLVIGRRLRNETEDKRPGLRFLPMSQQFFSFFSKSKKRGPDIHLIEATIKRHWEHYHLTHLKETWDEYFLRKVRTCVAGAHTAQGLRVIKNQKNDPFFVAYEMSRAHTARRNWLNIVEELKANVANGRMDEEETTKILSGGVIPLFKIDNKMKK